MVNLDGGYREGLERKFNTFLLTNGFFYNANFALICHTG